MTKIQTEWEQRQTTVCDRGTVPCVRGWYFNLRNVFLNWDVIGKFSQNKEFVLLKRVVLSLSKKSSYEFREISLNRNSFPKTGKIIQARKRFSLRKLV